MPNDDMCWDAADDWDHAATAERARCAEVPREHAQIALGHADLDAHEIAESIAEAIKRGAEDGGRKA